MNSSKKDKTPMDKLTQNYEKFIKGKEINNNGKVLFNQVIKKTIISKPQRNSK